MPVLTILLFVCKCAEIYCCRCCLNLVFIFSNYLCLLNGHKCTISDKFANALVIRAQAGSWEIFIRMTF